MAITRAVHALAAVTLAAAALLLPSSSIASADGVTTTATGAAANSVVADADVNAFDYSSWDSRFDVSLDEDGRARMHVIETLTAEFPEFDQNKGIVRGLPTTYRNAWLEVNLLSVTDGSGSPVPYETDEDDGLYLILTGNDDFVHGAQTYVIEYEMRDVILATDTGVDEFYWDLLPLDSTQPVNDFHAEITVDQSLADHFTGSTRCYVGVAGSRDECALRAAENGTEFTVTATDLAAGEGITAAIGFSPGTAVQPSARQSNPATDTVPAIAAAGALALSVGSWFVVRRNVKSRRTASGVIVAQYDVPDSMPPLLAAAIVPAAKDPIPAEIVHLAVRGNLRIEEGAEPEQPRLRRIPTTQIPDALDAEALDALFDDAAAVGIVDIPTSSEDFATRMTDLLASGREAATDRGFVTTARSRGAALLQTGAIAVALAGFVLGLVGVISGRVTALPAFIAILFAVFVALLSGLFSFSKHRVLTAEGARKHEYLMGVKEFIRVAEADRLRMLQSYSGAERRQDGTADVIVVYERLLPYAMLFGMEKEWGAVLESAYSSEHRDASWIGAPGGGFMLAHLAAFTASSNSAATYAAPSASSSSSAGGSFGGGFSGGGGGGGFSGGR